MVTKGYFSPKTQQIPMYQHITNFKNTAIFGHLPRRGTKRGCFFVKILTFVFTKRGKKGFISVNTPIRLMLFHVHSLRSKVINAYASSG